MDSFQVTTKPFTLVICEQQARGFNKYVTFKETRIQYSSLRGLKRGIARRFPSVEWIPAANATSYIFQYVGPATTTKRNRIMVYAFEDLPDTWKKVSINLSEYTK